MLNHLKTKNTALMVLMLLCISNLVWGSESVVKNQWLEDIDVYAEQLEKNHINLFHSVSKEDFHHKIESLRGQLTTLSENEILVRLMELTRMVEDGHTSFPLWGPQLHKFPLKFIAIDQRFFVTATTAEYQTLLKSELISINGKPVKEVFASLARLVPFSENPYSTAVRVAQYLPIAELLNGIGLIGDNYQAKLSFISQNESQTVTISTTAKTTQKFKKNVPNTLLASLDRQVSDNDWLWFASSADKQSIYLKFERYVTHDRMNEFASKLLDFINRHKSENIIIDLRDNFGGDFFVGLILAQYLVLADSLNWQSGIYVLINNVTFSAAMSNASQFKSILNAKLIGEPTGAKPRGYQDMGEFTLPNSKRVVTYSKRFYDFAGNDLGAVYPDKIIATKVSDFNKGSDRQLSWVFSRVNWH